MSIKFGTFVKSKNFLFSNVSIKLIDTNQTCDDSRKDKFGPILGDTLLTISD